jgi:release factor glutamine methyltransferase
VSRGGITVDAALATARAAGVDRLDAQLLLGALLRRQRTWLMAHGDDALGPAVVGSFHALVARRAAGEPVAYLLGEKEFFGLKLKVSPAVLVPRPDTETLVEWALALLAASAPGTQVLDLGTGSGAIALAIAQRRPAVRMTAVDASDAALAVAAANGVTLGLAVRWQRSDWFSALGAERFDLIVGNPPYIAEGDPHLEALRHEPPAALASGADGLDALRAIVSQAPEHLLPGGWLLLEHGHEQADAVAALLGTAGFRDVATRRDLAGRPRCTGACWPAGVHKSAEAHI